MPFEDALIAQRRAIGWTPTQAAAKLQISLRGYEDREAGIARMEFPERCGLLVGLGLTIDEAVALIENNPNVSNPLADIATTPQKHQRRHRDPFVRVTGKAFVFVNRQHDTQIWKIFKRDLKTSDDILKWVYQASEKSWVTGEHINVFIHLASDHIGFPLHPLEPPKGANDPGVKS